MRGQKSWRSPQRPSACTRPSACRDTEHAEGAREQGGGGAPQRRAPRCLFEDTPLLNEISLSCTPSPVTNDRGMRDVDLYNRTGLGDPCSPSLPSQTS